MFEFRLRILEAGPNSNSYLGIVEGFPAVMGHGRTLREAEADVIRALSDYLASLQDLEATRLQLDDFPTVRTVRLPLAPAVG